MNPPATYQSTSQSRQRVGREVREDAGLINALTCHITSGRVARHTLAAVLGEKLTDETVSRTIAGSTADKCGAPLAGVEYGDLVAYVGQILRSADPVPLSTTVNELLKPASTKLIAAKRIPEDIHECALGLARNLVNTQISKGVAHARRCIRVNAGDRGRVVDRIRRAGIDDEHVEYGELLASAGVQATQHGASTLATACLYAYLENEDNCTDALNSYAPSRERVDAGLIRKVAALTPVVTAQYHRNAQAVLAATSAQGYTAIAEALRACGQAEELTKLCEAICMLLATGPDTRNDARLGGALAALLKTLPDDARVTRLLAHQLAATHGLPAQYFVGAYVEKYGWTGLQELLLGAVEQKLQRVERTAASRAALALKRRTAEIKQAQANASCIRAAAVDSLEDRPRQASICKDSQRPWVQRVVPRLAVKLLIPHLRPYIEHDDFKYLDLPDYQALAMLLHDSRTACGAVVSHASVPPSARRLIRKRN